MVADWIVMFVIAFSLNVVSYLITPKPKPPKPDAARDLESPTAEAGRPIQKVFGTLTIRDSNILWHGDKASKSYEIKV